MSLNLHTVRITAITHPTSDVMVLEVVRTDGADLDSWAPGAHIDLHLPSGLIRQYSLCGDPADSKRYKIGILRDTNGRGGSVEAHDTLTAEKEVQIGTPRNHFSLVDAPSYLFIAGGIGITPMLPMMQAASQQGTPWSLAYGGRSRESMAFIDEVKAIAGDTHPVQIVPQDECGLLNLAELVANSAPGAAIYGCGPSPMLAALQEACSSTGKSSQLHIELFSAPVPANDGNVATDEPVAFTVELAKSGVTLDVGADQSLKDVLVNAGIPVPFSCEEGYCGSCETTVLSGTPEHHDSVLTPEEKADGKFMMVCVGRCRSGTLVLDL